MIRRAAALLLLLIALPVTAAEWIGQLPEAEMRAVEAAATQADANWNARDAAGLSAMYTGDATLVVGGTEVLRGREAVLAYFTRSFARTPASMRHTTLVDRMIVLAPDLVWADTRVALDDAGASGQLTRVRDFNTLTLLRKQDSQWKLHTVRAYPVPVAATTAAR